MVNVYEIRPGSYATVAEAKEGGSGGDVTKEYVDAGLAEKQDTLVAGANITIVENVISASGELASTEWGEIGGSMNNQTDLKNALDAKADASALNGKQDVLTAGQNITIENNVISADASGVSEVTATRDSGAYGQATKLTVVDDGVSTATTLFERMEEYDRNWAGATPHFYGTDFINDNFATKTEVQGVQAQIPDVSGLATKTEVTTGLAGKQNTLVSGTNIKTINNESILGEGNITVSGEAPSNMVTTDSDQSISGAKTFTGDNGTYGNANFIILNALISSRTPSIKFRNNVSNPVGKYGCTISSSGTVGTGAIKSNSMIIQCLSGSGLNEKYRKYLFYPPSTSDIGGMSDQSVEVMHSGMIPESTITGDGTTTSFTVTHSLGKMPGIVQVTGSNGVVVKDSEITITKSTTDVTVVFNTAPADATTYTVAMLY